MYKAYLLGLDKRVTLKAKQRFVFRMRSYAELSITGWLSESSSVSGCSESR